MRNLDDFSFLRRKNLEAYPGQAPMTLPPERPVGVDVSVDDVPLNLPPAPENIISPDIGMNQLPVIAPTNQLATPDLRTGRGTFSGQSYIEDQGPSTIGFGNLPTSAGRDPFPNVMPMASAEPSQGPRQAGDQFGGIRYDPRTTAMDAMYEMMQSRPQRGKTPLWRKIVAGTMAASPDPNTPQAMEEFMQAPYYKNLADWKDKWAAYKDLATLERYENVNQRYMTDSMLDALGRQKNLDLREAIAARRDIHWDVDSDGNIIGITSEGRVIETGRKDSELSDTQKISYGLDAASIEDKRTARAELIAKVTTDRAVTLKNMDISADTAQERLRQQGAQALEILRQKGRLTLAQRRALSSSSTVANANQVKGDWINNARSWLAKNPNDEAWLTFDANTGFPELKTVDEMIDSQYGFIARIRGDKPPDRAALEKYRETMRQAIFTEPRVLRQSASQSGGTTTTVTTPTTTQAQPTAKPRTLRLISPDGIDVGTIPEGTRVPQGFTTKEP